jgi:osmotically-inducible protein OsmY
LIKIKSIILAISLCLSLSSCVGVFVAGAATGAAINDSRSFSELEKDTRISHDVSMVLTREPKLKTSHIVVASFYQMVFIGGEVPIASFKSLAERLAIKVPGVRRVYNQITIGPNNTLKNQAKDAWLTTKIKTSMLAKSGLKSGAFKVLSENSVVFLMGEVSHEQANLAVDVARRIEGVDRVVKLFKYTD